MEQFYTRLDKFNKNYKVFESLFNETGSVFVLQNKLDTILKSSIKVLNSGLAFTKKKWTTLLNKLEDLPNRNEVNIEEQVKALIRDLSSLNDFWSQIDEMPLKDHADQ